MLPSDRTRARWQWQPTLTAHDPNPPITLEDVVVTGNTYDDMVSVARLEALFSSVAYNLGASLMISERDFIFQNNVAAMGARVGLSELNGISDRATVSIGNLVSINQLTGFNNSLSLGAFSVVNLSDRLSILHGVNLDSHPVVSLSERDGVAVLATLHIFPSVTFTERDGISFSAGLSFFQSLSLGAKFFVVTDSTVTANVIAVILQTLSESLGISSSVQMDRQASIPVAEKVGISNQIFQIINPSLGLNVLCSIVTSEGQAVIIVRGFGYVFTTDSRKHFSISGDTSMSVETGDS